MSNSPKSQAIATEGAGLLIIRAFNIGTGFLTIAILTRGLGPDGFATYAFVQAVAAVLSLSMHWGIYTFLTREVAASTARSEHERTLALEVFSRNVLLASIPSAALVFIGCCAALRNFGIFELSATMIGCIILLAAQNACQQRAVAILSGRSRQVSAQFPEGFARPALFITFLAVLGPVWSKEAAKALYLYAFAAAFTLLITTCLTIRTRKTRCPNALLKVPYREWLGQLPPFVLIGMIGIAMANADVIVLFSVLPRSDLGQYKLAAVIASIPANLHSIVISMLMPRAAAAWARGDKFELTRLAATASKTSFLFATIYSTLLFLIGSYLIEYVFGSNYGRVYYLSCLLLIPVMCTTFVGSAFTILNMCGQAPLNSAIALVGMVGSIVTLWAFGKLWGADGAAAAAIIVGLTTNAAAWVAVKRRLGMRCDAFG